MSALGQKQTFAVQTDHVRKGQNQPSAKLHSITSSARASSEVGICIPIVLAVLRLITNRKLVGCWTGRSPNLAPLRIRSSAQARTAGGIARPSALAVLLEGQQASRLLVCDRHNCATETRDELAPLHSITSSAREIRACGTLMPSAFAAF